MTINIIDAGCGVGKTTAAINKINNDNNMNHKYLYITPILTEVNRIKNSCINRKFKEPEAKTTKLNDIIHLFETKSDIVSTHALFKKFNEQILDLAKVNDYILIMDEVAEVVEELPISKDDMKTILKEYVEVDDKGLLKWYAIDYEGKFEEYKQMIEMGGVVVNKDSKGNPISFVWMFPMKIFEAFKEVYIITYMFDGQIQKSYYEYNNVKFKYWFIEDGILTNQKKEYDYSKTKSLIRICSSNKLNKIGIDRGSLSVSWFERNKDGELMKQLKNNIYGFFKNHSKTKINENLWTTFKEYKNILKGKGYSSCFGSVNMRATNDYREKTAIVYAANRFLKPTMKNFFLSHNIGVNEDIYALSELIQFIFRGAIRDENPIYVYIPSKRMRTLLNNWIKQ